MKASRAVLCLRPVKGGEKTDEPFFVLPCGRNHAHYREPAPEKGARFGTLSVRIRRRDGLSRGRFLLPGRAFAGGDADWHKSIYLI